MSEPDVREVKLWFTGRETSAARLYSKVPRSRRPGREDEVWLPLSQIEHTTKHPPTENEWPVHLVRIPEWLAANHSL